MIGLIDDIDANGELYVCAWGRTSGQVAMVMMSWWWVDGACACGQLEDEQAIIMIMIMMDKDDNRKVPMFLIN